MRAVTERWEVKMVTEGWKVSHVTPKNGSCRHGERNKEVLDVPRAYIKFLRCPMFLKMSLSTAVLQRVASW